MRNPLVALGVIVVLAATIGLVVGRHAPTPATDASRGSGHGFTTTPAPPHLPGTASGPRLTGFVVDGAGLPVAGASVSAELEAMGSGSGSAVATSAIPPTGNDGHFIIDGLAPGRYRVHVTGAGLLAAEVRFVPVPSDEARIVVARQISIDGTVTDGGKPVAGATVGIRGDAIGGGLEVVADPRGAFHVPDLPEGRYQVYAWQQALAARAVRVSRLGAGPFAPVELRLEAGAIVVGRVIDRSEGTALVAAIELRPQGDDQAPRYARSGDDGVFRIEGVPNGTWIADAFAPGYISPGGVELEAGKGVPELALERGAAIEGRVVDPSGKPIAGASVRALTAGASPTEYSADVDQDRLRRFSGRSGAPAPSTTSTPMSADPQLIARGELGVMVGPIPPLPLPGEQVARPAAVVDPKAIGLVGEPAPLASSGNGVRASIWTTGSDGRYRITGIAKGKVTALAIAAEFAEGRSREVTLAANDVISDVDVVLGAGTYVAGRVTDQSGAPVAGAEVSAQPEVGAPVENFTDSDGQYRIGPLSGKLVLRVSAYGHGEARLALELALADGTTAAEHREDVVLEVADATLLGTLVDSTGIPVGGAHLEIVAGPSEGRGATSSSDGVFAIEMLPRGHVRVRVDHPAYPTQELDAAASTTGERARLVVALGGAIEGVLLDARTGDPLASTSLSASGPGGATTETSTASTGRWKLGPVLVGHWRLTIAQPGYMALARDFDVPAATSPGGTSIRDVRIELTRGALIGGTVRDGRGQRVAGAHVVIRSTAGEVAGDADAQGEFRIHDAPTGDVDVIATKGDAAGTTRATITPGDEVLGLALEIR
ncbi:MAG TPA: carboxypeptidase-like regulatory domain-containing protein [Kofleriaceae bacterium]|jgi:protocatechuate 3,4-dioxygenase beta subunit|nr:carboxypeptidase-like regulatory domain-containing protein [Kofleriaceae bacterium]